MSCPQSVWSVASEKKDSLHEFNSVTEATYLELRDHCHQTLKSGHQPWNAPFASLSTLHLVPSSSKHFLMASICIWSLSRSSVFVLVQLNKELRKTSHCHDYPKIAHLLDMAHTTFHAWKQVLCASPTAAGHAIGKCASICMYCHALSQLGFCYVNNYNLSFFFTVINN